MTMSESRYLSYLNTFGFIVTPARLVSSKSSNSSALRIFLAATPLVTLWTFVTDEDDITKNNAQPFGYQILQLYLAVLFT